ncbi:hypothetical protein HYPSUDRAFT_389884 [Hypholoma sublateritium FD-334 SS-4]|uniref:Uncharacterized protein n=1 Tax=Hypholoma sublateritium (strain FD-334 SS-4) TaxID=945553 RepID=A0A0D2KL48_HYPSF|nr:hypothetical protein HYPSUDRAFT_389884 [Hypholoma sublateritium FD-334 SS-4]
MTTPRQSRWCRRSRGSRARARASPRQHRRRRQNTLALISVVPSADEDVTALTAPSTPAMEGAAAQEPETETTPVPRPMVERRRVLRALAVARQASASSAAPAAQPAAADANAAASAGADEDDDDDSDEDDSDDDMATLAPNARRSTEDAALAAELEAAFASDDDADSEDMDADAPFVDPARIAADQAVTEAALAAMRVARAEREARKAALASLAMEAARVEAERVQEGEEEKEEEEEAPPQNFGSGVETSIDELVDHAAEGARMMAEMMQQRQQQQVDQQDGALAQHSYAPEPAQPATQDADAEDAAEEERRAEFEQILAAIGISQPSTVLQPPQSVDAYAAGGAPPPASAQDVSGLSMLALLAEMERLKNTSIVASASQVQGAPTASYSSLAHAVDEDYIRRVEPAPAERWTSQWRMWIPAPRHAGCLRGRPLRSGWARWGWECRAAEGMRRCRRGTRWKARGGKVCFVHRRNFGGLMICVIIRRGVERVARRRRGAGELARARRAMEPAAAVSQRAAPTGRIPFEHDLGQRPPQRTAAAGRIPAYRQRQRQRAVALRRCGLSGAVLRRGAYGCGGVRAAVSPAAPTAADERAVGGWRVRRRAGAGAGGVRAGYERWWGEVRAAGVFTAAAGADTATPAGAVRPATVRPVPGAVRPAAASHRALAGHRVPPYPSTACVRRLRVRRRTRAAHPARRADGGLGAGGAAAPRDGHGRAHTRARARVCVSTVQRAAASERVGRREHGRARRR